MPDEIGSPQVGRGEDERRLERLEERIREQASLLDRARDAIVVRDLRHVVTYWNQGAERLYGWTAAEAVGRSVESLIQPGSDRFLEATSLLLKQGEWAGELVQLRRDSSPLTVESRWTLLRDEAGEPQKVLAINTDISERKRLEAQFLRAQRMESIGTLAGGIAHDLNNVLAPITMSIGLLQEHVTDPEAREILSTIEISAARGADMVKQVLSFARGMEGPRIPTDVGGLLEDVGRIVRETFPRNIHFRTDPTADTWKILGDPTQVHQVLLNLCVNARDAMPQGGELRISAENVTLDEHFAEMSGQASPGPYVRLGVSDTGVGIAPAIIDQIFDPFFTTKDVGEGTGLGLATARAIARDHGGTLAVQSEEGSGTTFVLYLPALPSKPAVEQPRNARSRRKGSGELILVVDDEEAVCRVTRRTLEAHGYRVLTAPDGADALGLYARACDEVAVVLTDLMMPVLDGPSTIRALKRMNPDVKVVAASGLSVDGVMARAAAAGVRHFLWKPYTAGRLLEVLDEVIREEG